MAMRLRKRIEEAKKALRGNSGAGLLVVVITSLVVLLLGSALLYASYNVYVLRLTQMRSETNFTSADAGMEEIRAGLQGVSSDAIGAGYDNVIAHYTEGATEETFREGYFKCLFNWEDENNVKLFTGSSSTSISSYNVEVLKGFLDPVPDTAEYTLTAGGSDSSTGAVLQDTSTGTLTLKDLRLTYIKNGYETTISTDLYLAVPPVPIYSAINTSDVADYVIIADKGIQVGGNKSGNLVVDGDTYAGDLKIGDRSTVTVKQGRSLVVGRTYEMDTDGQTILKNTDGTDKMTPGNVSIEGTLKYDKGKSADKYKSQLTLEDNARLWAHEINVDGSSLNMTGGDNSAIYVADDLNIGRYSDVTLKGTYFGFGNGSSVFDEPIGTNISALSSAILFRTKGDIASSLDMSGLTSLTLAGTAYVMPTDAGSEVRMGSSITTRAEQLAYLVPESMLGGRSNPEIQTSTGGSITADEAAAETSALKTAALANSKKALWSGTNMTMTSYGIDSDEDIAVLSYPISSSQRVYYTFMNFPTRDLANKYFTDFFSKNSATVSSYISQYASLKTLPSGASASMAGTGLSKEGDTYKVTTSTGDNADTNSTRYQKIYQTLSRTMTTNNTQKTTPFNFYINRAALDEMLDGSDKVTTGEWKHKGVDEAGHETERYYTASAVQTQNGTGAKWREITYKDNTDNTNDSFVIARGNYEVDVRPDKQKLVICDGNVIIKNNSLSIGMIICSRKVYVMNNLTLEKFTGTADIPSIMDQLNNYSHGIWRGSHQSQTEDNGTWSVDEIVGFRNWKKNAE